MKGAVENAIFPVPLLGLFGSKCLRPGTPTSAALPLMRVETLRTCRSTVCVRMRPGAAGAVGGGVADGVVVTAGGPTLLPDVEQQSAADSHFLVGWRTTHDTSIYEVPRLHFWWRTRSNSTTGCSLSTLRVHECAPTSDWVWHHS